MRILILSDLYPPYYKGGHEIQCKIVADGLSNKGHEVVVLTSRYGVNEKTADGKLFRLLYYLGDNGSGVFLKRYMQLKLALLGRLNYYITSKIVKKIKPDIAYAGELSGISIFPMIAIQRKNISIVHHLGNYYLVELVKDCILKSNLLKRIYRKIIYGFYGLYKFDFSHLITVSKALKKQHVEVGFYDKNISIIPRGISSGLIKNKLKNPSPHLKREIKLLYVGRISKEKGVHISIQAVKLLIKELKKFNIVFYIIGDGDGNYIKQLSKLLVKLGIENNVKFCGKFSREKILREYSKFDILLFPSVWEEPFSGVLIEAMSQGLPIVATNTGGTPELITNNYNGLLVPPNDSVKMAKSVKELILNHSLFEKVRENGIKKIKTGFSNEIIIEKIENYLNNVFNKSGNIPK